MRDRMPCEFNFCLLFIVFVIGAVLVSGEGKGVGEGISVTERVDLRTLVENGIKDGAADIGLTNNNQQVSVRAADKFTIWHPQHIEGEFNLSFDCLIPEEKTKVLIFLYAMPNDGNPISGWESEGNYLDYTTGLQTYTLGINRGTHTGKHNFSPYDDNGRQDVANLRRLGVFRLSKEHTEKIGRERRESGLKRSWQTPTWQAWNRASTLCSVAEPESGIGKWIRYEIHCKPPYISYYVNGKLAFEVVDHNDNPLRQGYIGFRCMSPGKEFRLRNIVLKKERGQQRKTQN